MVEQISEKITDDELLNIVKKKLEEKDHAMYDLEKSHKNLQDINERLVEAEKAKTMFLSNLKNEINNPLASLIALGEEIEDMDESSAQKKSYNEIAKIVLRDVLSLDFQMRNLMAAAELEAGDVDLHIVKVDVNNIIETAIKNLAPLIDEVGVEIKIEAEKPLWVNTDSDKLYQVIINLLSNAIIFNKNKGVVKVTMNNVDGKFTCNVLDEGVGIEADDLDVIFNSFVQLDKGLTKRFRGHGLGLSVTKAFVELLEGRVGVESTVDKGSSFTIEVASNADFKTDSTFEDGVELFGNDSEGETF